MNWQSEFLDSFEVRLRTLLLVGIQDQKFQEALLYQFFPAGKRLRPRLMAAYALDLGQSIESILDFACAIEILHTASLIHDDLPALDNDAERRGKPTLHIKVGQGTALLCADYLIARALAICSEVSVKKINRTGAISSTMASAFCDLCFGQELDIRNSAAELECSLDIYDLKTGALFAAGFEIARLLCFEQEELKDETKTFAKAFGRSFQVLNDFSDLRVELTDNAKERSANSDARNKRATALSLLSANAQVEFVDNLHRKSRESLKSVEEAFVRIKGLEEIKFVHLRDLL